MDRSDAAHDREKQDGRDPFERFVEAANQLVSRGPFFLICVVIVVVWFASYPFWPSSKEWQVAIHTVASVLTILLLVLIENAGRRAEEASQEKLNELAEALSDLMASRAREDPELEDAVRRLRDAVGLEGRH
ncbi:MAG: low affinity iron permease family protein [Nocardioides sp.]